MGVMIPRPFSPKLVEKLFPDREKTASPQNWGAGKAVNPALVIIRGIDRCGNSRISFDSPKLANQSFSNRADPQK